MDAAQTPGKSSIRINIRKTERMLSAGRRRFPADLGRAEYEEAPGYGTFKDHRRRLPAVSRRHRALPAAGADH